MLETCGGLVTGAVAERLGGFGTVCCAYTGRSPPSQDAVRMFNFPWAMRDSLCCASLERLSTAADGDCTSNSQAGEGTAASPLANGTAMLASPPPAGAVAAQAEAAVTTVAIAVDVIQSPAASEPQQQADQTQADISAQNSTANGPMTGPEAACSAPPLAASTVAVQTAVQTLLDSGACVTANAIDETLVVPSVPGAAPAQQSEAATSVSEQNGNDAPAAGRTPRNMEPKRCITAVPPARLDQLRALVRPGFDSCIIAAPGLQPLAAVQRLLPFLASSASLVVFSPHLQPLAEAMAGLQASKAATNLQLQVRRSVMRLRASSRCMSRALSEVLAPQKERITADQLLILIRAPQPVQESWWREHQVLPFRTHPQMSTTGTGGYLLSGIKVVADSSAAPAAPQSQPGGKVESSADRVAEAPAGSADKDLAVPAAPEAAQAEEPSAKKLKLQDSSTFSVAVLEPN